MRPVYRKCTTTTEVIRLDADGRLTAEGGICWTLSSGNTVKRKELATLNARGIKLGLKIKTGQRIEHLAFVNKSERVVLRQDAGVSREFRDAFGADANEEWVAFVASPPLRLKPRAARANMMCFDTTFTLTEFRSRLQILPIVYTYLDMNVGDHHMLCVRVPPSTRRAGGGGRGIPATARAHDYASVASRVFDGAPVQRDDTAAVSTDAVGCATT